MLRLSGWGAGLALLLMAGLVAIVGMHVIMSSAVRLEIYTFSGLLSACLGKMSGVFLDLSLFCYGTGSCITYFIFLGDFIPGLVIAFLGHNPASDLAELRTICLMASWFFVVPLCLPKELSALRNVSPIALLGILWTAMVVCFKAREHWKGFDSDEIEVFNSDGLERNIFRCFSMCVFAFNCHINVVPVAQELENPQPRRVLKITSRVAGVQLVLYILLAFAGYLSFGMKTPANIITAYGDNDPLIILCRVLLSITMWAAIPTSVNPTVRSLLNLCEVCFPSLQESAEGPDEPQGKLQPLLSGALVKPPEAKKPLPPAFREGLRVVFAISSCLAQCWVAIKVSNVATVIGILGATVSTLMMMVIPVLLMHIACPDLYSPMFKWMYTVILSLAAVMSVTTLFVT